MARRPTPNLKRRGHRREPKQRFIVFCEGKNTEPSYFREFRRTFLNALIDVETIRAAGVPYTLATAAAERAKSSGLSPRSRRKKNSFEQGDEVWAVFDRDEHPRFEEAVNICHQAGVRVGRSNPCFELWLILHEEEYDKPVDRHGAQAHLKKLRPEYDKDRAKTPDCSDLVTRVEEAEKRAETLLTRRDAEGDPHGPASTTVGRLTRAIRDAAESASRK